MGFMDNLIMNLYSSLDKIIIEKTFDQFDQYKFMQHKIGNFN
jgi:hypothetical protein